MPSLKDYRTRIASVKNTRKITSAMKMVAASKLRQAQSRAEQAQPYTAHLNDMLARLVMALGNEYQNAAPLLGGHNKREQKILLLVVSADRGLAGGFNSNLVRDIRRQINLLLADGKDVTIVTVGRKARDLLKRDFPQYLGEHYALNNKFATADMIMRALVDTYYNKGFDKAFIAFNHFKNTMTQIPTIRQLIPFRVPETLLQNLRRHDEAESARAGYRGEATSIYTFEPNATSLLDRLLPLQIAADIYRVILESNAGEQAARMTAMDNATRNAGDMINGLTLSYNRARQAYITKEVSEIVAGAEASANV
ncbi:MAG TPA: ATP synthase F1 subunit gamma [Alphaproteobacteria bacterium]